MIGNILIIAIIVITAIVVYLFVRNEQVYRRELDKIEMLERSQMQRQRELEQIRSRTTPCPKAGLDNPRKCFFDSQQSCSWNIEADRCDKL